MNINWINVSGGKDSTALLLWTLEEELPNCRYVYADTGWEHPSVYEYLDYLERETGVEIERIESEGMEALCIRKGIFPARYMKFCTEQLKVLPMARHMDAEEVATEDNPHLVWVGVRRQESARRSALPETMESHFKYPPKQTSWQLVHHPLLDWSVEDVFAIHKKYGIEPNPLYLAGMGRVGCFPCINAKNELRVMFERYPEVIEKVADLERRVNEVSKEGRATFFSEEAFPGMPTDIRSIAKWAASGVPFPGMEQPVEGCLSRYGLCE